MHQQLRAPQDDDAEWLLEALNDPRTNHALIDLPHPYPASFIPEFWLDDTQPLLQFVWFSPLASSPTCSGISSELLSKDPALPRGDDNRIGYIWLSVSDDDNAELSFLLHPHFQGQGFGLQQLPHIFKWLAQHMQVCFKTTNISSHTRPTNKAAQKLLTACGFTLVKTTKYPTTYGEALLQKWLIKLN